MIGDDFDVMEQEIEQVIMDGIILGKVEDN